MCAVRTTLVGCGTENVTLLFMRFLLFFVSLFKVHISHSLVLHWKICGTNCWDPVVGIQIFNAYVWEYYSCS